VHTLKCSGTVIKEKDESVLNGIGERMKIINIK